MVTELGKLDDSKPPAERLDELFNLVKSSAITTVGIAAPSQ